MTVVRTEYRIVCPNCQTGGTYLGKQALVCDKHPDQTYRWVCCGLRAPLPPSTVIDREEHV